MIDVRELMARLSDADLLQAADAYFTGLTLDSEQCHKPFSNAHDAVHLHRSLSLLLQAADLYKGAEVLDFGCATGWLTLSLATLGCDVLGVDVAPTAIALARQWQERRGVRPGGSARFAVYDGHALPLPDASIDRVLCFDAFHHVRDQAATLREFARVLRPGGRIAMLEPGPNHSRTPQSQMEMSLYKVIENDIDMSQIASHAHASGLNPPAMLVQMPQPLQVSLADYLHWAHSPTLPASAVQTLMGAFGQELTNTQCFFIGKPGVATMDSRQPGGLAAQLRLLSAQPAPQGGWALQVSVKNVGEAVWRTRHGVIGQVTLGLQLIDANGTLVNREFLRFALGEPALAVGAERQISCVVGKPVPAGCALRFDLVAEHVCWFADNGRNAPLDWAPAA